MKTIGTIAANRTREPRELRTLGDALARAFPVDGSECFTGLIQAIDSLGGSATGDAETKTKRRR